jgi:hypothetical protein
MKKRYLRKRDLCTRYSVVPMTIDRWVRDGILPPPNTRITKSPLWLESVIEARDKANADTPAYDDANLLKGRKALKTKREEVRS